MKRTVKLYLIAVLIFATNNLFSQIVNMESQRYHTDTIGWKGSINGNFALTNYGEKVFAVDANAHIQYQSKKSLYLLLGSYGFLKGGDQSFIDNSFLHFRYNYKLSRIVRLEAFAQLQQNAITKIDSRFLVGVGPRFKIAASKRLKVYAGSLVVYEVQKEAEVQSKIHDWRSSNYVSITFLPSDQTELVTTTYYQPVFNQFSDYRLLNQTIFKIKAGKKIYVNLNWNYQFDATPATGVPRETYSFSTGIELSL